MRIGLLLALLLFLVPGVVLAASFDCAKAHSPLEHAICDNPALSRADEQLAKAYDDGLRKLGDGAGILRRTQRLWLKDLPDQLKRLGVAAVQSGYEERLKELQAIPDFPSPAQEAAGDTIEPSTAPHDYDVTLRLIRPCLNSDDDNGGFCTVPGQVIVRPAGKPDVLQVINIPAVLMDCTLDANAKAGTPQNCGTGGLLAVEDYNFDGRDDIAVANDEPGGYGAFGADIFLFDPVQKKFVYSPEISALAASLVFQVDKTRKQLRTSSKGGCCYHEDTIYRVENNLPVPVSRHIEDATDAMNGAAQMKIIDSRWIGGRWVDKVRYQK
jgi:uncharacterized protein